MGKKIVDEDMRLNIKINGNEAKNELFELEEKVRDLSGANEKLERSIQKYNKQLEQNEKTVEKYNKTLEKEKANLDKQEQAYSAAHANLTTLLDSYRKLDQAGKESTYGKRLLTDIQKQEEAVRRSGESGRKSKQAVENLEKSLKKLGVENQKLIKKRDEDSASLKKNSADLEMNKGKVEKLRKNLDVTTLSIDELNREITRMNVLFRNTDPNDPKWKEYQRTLITLRRRQQELGAQGQATKGVLCRMADGVNKYWNMVLSGMASLTGVVFGIKSAINKYVEFTDVLADVRKTTNLTEEGVKELNEELKKIDTRSPQEELMGLARIGGKLGIEGKENLLGFVRAADQINIALKEDLGGDTEEAIRQVGKIVDIFKVNDKFGIEQGMLKVGSVINELGMASTANEGYIVEFTKRVAGIAPMTKIQVPAVMGLAATFDKFGQTAEVASTVYSQVMTQMFKKTRTYAKIAGMEVKEFSELLKVDANEAFIRVMEGLKGNDGEIEKMIASMGDMEMEGKRAVGVLGVLADNTQTLREQQNLANQAFEEGISLTNEAEVKNNNLAAQRAKVKKDLDERIKQLGEKLYPLMTTGMNLMTKTVTVLGVLVDITTKYGGKVLWLASVIGTYTLVVKGAVMWRKLEEALVLRAITFGLKEANGVKALTAVKVIFTGVVKKATTAIKALGVTLLMNPWAAVAAGVAAVLGYLVFFVDRTTEAEKAQKRLNDIQKKYSQQLGEEKASLVALLAQIKQTNPGTKRRIELVDELASKFPGLINEQDLYRASLDQLTILEKSYRDELEKRIRLQSNVAQFEDLIKQQQDKEEVLDSLEKKRTRLTMLINKERNEWIKDRYKQELRETEQAIESKKSELAVLEEKKGGINLTGNTHRRDFDKELNELQVVYDKKLIQEDVYERKKNQIELDRLYDFLENEKLVGEERVLLEQRIAEKLQEIKNGESGKTLNTGIDYANDILSIKEKYAKRLITQEEYENKLDVLELAHLECRLKNEDMNDKQRVELQQKIADKKISIIEKAKKREQHIENVIDSASPAELKEKKAYEERLRQAGLFGVAREKMTKKQLQAFEILEKQHNDNLAKIEKDAKKKQTDDYMQGLNIQIKNTEMGQAMEVARLKVAQNAELEVFSGSLYQRNEMLKRHQLEQLNLSEDHAREMITVLSNIFGKIDSDEFTLGEGVLTEEQKNELLKRFEELKAAASGFVASGEELEKRQVSDVDILGMSGSKWEEFFDNLKKGTEGIQEIEFAVGTLENAWSAYTKLRAAQTQKELKQYEQKTKKEKAELDKQLDSGQISQEQYNARVSQLDADLDAKKEKLEKEQRERERTQAIFSTTVSTAVGVAKAWELGPILGPIMAALVAAMGVMQIATIQAAQYATGKYPVVGADDGRTYDAEYVGNNIQTGVYEKPTLGLFSEKEPEMVVDGNTTRKLIFDYPQVYRSIIDVSRGRIPQFANGRYPMENSTISSDMFVGGKSDPEMKQLLTKNMQMMDRLMNMEFSIPMYGNNGLVKKIKKAQDYEQNIKTGKE